MEGFNPTRLQKPGGNEKKPAPATTKTAAQKKEEHGWCYLIITPNPHYSIGTAKMVNGRPKYSYQVKFGDGPGKRYQGTDPDFGQAVNESMRWAKAFENRVLKSRGFISRDSNEWYTAHDHEGRLEDQLTDALDRFSGLDCNQAMATARAQLGAGADIELLIARAADIMAAVMLPFFPAEAVAQAP